MVKLAILPLAFILQVIPADGKVLSIKVSGGAGFGPRKTFRTIASSTAAGLTFSSAPGRLCTPLVFRVVPRAVFASRAASFVEPLMTITLLLLSGGGGRETAKMPPFVFEVSLSSLALQMVPDQGFQVMVGPRTIPRHMVCF